MRSEETYAAEIWAPRDVSEENRGGKDTGVVYTDPADDRDLVLGTSWDTFKAPLPNRGEYQIAYDRLYRVLGVVHPDADHPDHSTLAMPHVLLGPTSAVYETAAELRELWLEELCDAVDPTH